MRVNVKPTWTFQDPQSIVKANALNRGSLQGPRSSSTAQPRSRGFTQRGVDVAGNQSL